MERRKKRGYAQNGEGEREKSSSRTKENDAMVTGGGAMKEAVQ